MGRDVAHHHRRGSEREYDGGEEGVGVDVDAGGGYHHFFSNDSRGRGGI